MTAGSEVGDGNEGHHGVYSEGWVAVRRIAKDES